MKHKKENLVLTVAFCGLLGAMLLGYLFLPKLDFSQLEKRYLAEKPKVSWTNIASGSFGSEAESYMADHIPGRDFLVGLYSYYSRLTQGEASQDIYVTSTGALVESPVNENTTATDKNMLYIQEFAETVGQSVDFVLIPSAGWAGRDTLRGLCDPYRDAEIIAGIYARAGSHVNTLDMTHIFENRPELYYRTDHHWTSRGAYLAAKAYLEGQGRTIADEDSFEKETVDSFYGSTYSRSGLWLTKPDSMELWHGSKSIRVETGNGIHEGPFYMQRLQELDKYTVFLDGNHAKVTLTNPDAPKGKLLVIRDSYANCLGSFLAEGYETVVLVDLRYYKEPLSQLCAQEGFDQILICYSIGNFLTDTNLGFLR